MSTICNSFGFTGPEVSNIGGRKHFVAASSTRNKNTKPFQKSESGPRIISIFDGAARPNISRIRWNNDHRHTNCPRSSGCRGNDDHFRIWRKTYEKYLDHLYSTFSKGINPSKVSLSEFSEFAYSCSSGYISRFA